MNVMALAHKATREVIANCASVKLDYRSLFRAALIDLHRKDKEMTAKNSQITSLEQYIVRCQESLDMAQDQYDNCNGDEFVLIYRENGMIMTEDAEKTKLSIGNYTNALRLTKRMAEAYCRKYSSGLLDITPISAYFSKHVTYWKEQITTMTAALEQVKKEVAEAK